MSIYSHNRGSMECEDNPCGNEDGGRASPHQEEMDKKKRRFSYKGKYILIEEISSFLFSSCITCIIRRDQSYWTQLSCRGSGHWGQTFVHVRNRTTMAMDLVVCLLLVNLYSCLTTSQAQTEVVEVNVEYDCSDIWDANNASTSGIYWIQPKATEIAFPVFCEMSQDGGWTLIQRHDGSDALNFNRLWADYKNGFGELKGEHWLGLDYIYALTQQPDRPAKLHISIGSFDGKEAYAEYNPFSVGNEDSSYKLSVGNYSGTAGDAFLGNGDRSSNQYGSTFSTTDNPTDGCHYRCKVSDMIYRSCSAIYKAGWWFNACGSANLNGNWRQPPVNIGYASSVLWPTWRVRESLKFSKMYLIH